jgi:AraC family transcriptional regulator
MNASVFQPAVMTIAETHGIALKPGNRLIVHSEGRGWHDVYGSLASEIPWAGLLPPVAHHCLVYCVGGTAIIRHAIDDVGRTETAVLGPRNLTVIPANVASRWEVEGHPDILLLYLRRSMMDRIVEEAFGADAAKAEIIPRLAVVDPLLEQLALAVLDCLQGDNDEGAFYADGLARAIAMRLVARHTVTPGRQLSSRCTPRDATEARLRRVRDYVEASLGEDLTLGLLADEAGVSQDYLARAFRNHYGETPHRYVIRRRVEWAKHLLRATDSSIV